MKRGLMIFLPVFAFLLSACANHPVYRVETKEVLVPVKCNLQLPQKPQENGSFQSHKELMKYFVQVEQIAKDCTQNF